MSDIRIKACPLLGCSYSMEQSILRGHPPIISARLIPCMGENCINFAWDDNDGYCRYFQKYTNHDRRRGDPTPIPSFTEGGKLTFELDYKQKNDFAWNVILNLKRSEKRLVSKNIAKE